MKLSLSYWYPGSGVSIPDLCPLSYFVTKPTAYINMGKYMHEILVLIMYAQTADAHAEDAILRHDKDLIRFMRPCVNFRVTIYSLCARPKWGISDFSENNTSLLSDPIQDFLNLLH